LAGYDPKSDELVETFPVSDDVGLWIKSQFGATPQDCYPLAKKHREGITAFAIRLAPTLDWFLEQSALA
jgi:hypothetical protein